MVIPIVLKHKNPFPRRRDRDMIHCRNNQFRTVSGVNRKRNEWARSDELSNFSDHERFILFQSQQSSNSAVLTRSTSFCFYEIAIDELSRIGRNAPGILNRRATPPEKIGKPFS